MSLYMASQVSVESWVELDEHVTLSVETEPESDCASLRFGTQNDFVLRMYREDLAKLLRLAGAAHEELEAYVRGDTSPE